jgi:hypothetical protein
MRMAVIGVAGAIAVALGLLCMPAAQARADNPCAGITGPAARQACIDSLPHDNPMRRYPLGDCEGASPIDGQLGQICG